MSLGDGRLVADLAAAAFHVVAERFPLAPSYRGGLFLMWGGLVVIALFTTSALVRASSLSDLRPRPEGASRRLAFSPGVERLAPPASVGRDVGAALAETRRPRSLDETIDVLAALGSGEGILIDSVPGFKRIRILRSERLACEAQTAFLERAVTRLAGRAATARHACCRQNGADACEFEVRY